MNKLQLEKEFDFSPRVSDMLAKSGWTVDYRWDEDKLDQYVATLERIGMPVHSHARDFLKRFGGIICKPQRVGSNTTYFGFFENEPREHAPINLKTRESREELAKRVYEYHNRWVKHIQSDVSPTACLIGYTHHREMEFFVDANNHFWLAVTEAGKGLMGLGAKNSLENLFSGDLIGPFEEWDW